MNWIIESIKRILGADKAFGRPFKKEDKTLQKELKREDKDREEEMKEINELQKETSCASLLYIASVKSLLDDQYIPCKSGNPGSPHPTTA